MAVKWWPCKRHRDAKKVKLQIVTGICPTRRAPFTLSFDKFCSSLEWVGTPDHEVRATCCFLCPVCGEEHRTDMP